MKKLVILIIVFIILVGCNNKEEEIVDALLFKDNVEVYSKIKLSDIIDFDIKEDFEIDTKKIGLKEIDFEYTEENETKKGIVKLNVIDSTPPYIGIGNYYNHIINTNFTFDKDVICGDNYDKDVKCEIVGDYDLNSLGETNLKVVAKDSSNNITEKEFTLRIIEKPNKNKEEVYLKHLLWLSD